MTLEMYVTNDELLAAILQNFSKEDALLIRRAWTFARGRYAAASHPSGKPYLDFMLNVSRILDDLGSDISVIAAALLYPPQPSYAEVYPDLEAEFADQTEWLHIINELHALSNLEWDVWPITAETKDERARDERARKDVLLKMVQLAVEGDGLERGSRERERRRPEAAYFQKREKQVENIIRMFLAGVDDVRALIIRLADRLYFMRQLKYLSDAEREQLHCNLLARTTLAIYAPLADRLGLWQLKSELEDMSFRLLDLAAYKRIADQLATKKEERARVVNEIIPLIKDVLKEYPLEVEVSGRAKHIYSIHKKMEARQLSLDQINDLFGIRILVDLKQDCYDVLEIILDRWPPVTSFYDGERSRDWIATPKENGYQSLHTTININEKIVEVQIRTHKMHEQAEYGAAAEHWRYKDPKIYRKGKTPRVTKEREVLWGKHLSELRKTMENQQEAVELMQKGLLKERIYVITPKGHALDFPKDATPLDFAYRIHTELGHRYSGAKVDRRIVRLDYHLQNGEIVELIGSRPRPAPNPDWLARSKDEEGNSSPTYARSRNTREKIQSWLKKHDSEV
jgi:guanosine-3',5'-bis(diphosphate) 3'-pyrophosphohydrolase